MSMVLLVLVYLLLKHVSRARDYNVCWSVSSTNCAGSEGWCEHSLKLFFR